MRSLARPPDLGYPRYMIMTDGQVPWIEDADDFSGCAARLARDSFPGEFTLTLPPDPDRVERAALGGFMPMSLTLENGATLLLPKLHTERCVLDPSSAACTGTARRESSRYAVSLNRSFDRVLAACADTHGDDWLSPALRQSFSALHSGRRRRTAAWLSVEVWRDETLVAGEIGYLIGTAYASLSGFRLVSGAGSVQLAALGAILAGHGVTVWDLGMPMPYKARLGGRNLARDDYLALLYAAYAMSRNEALLEATDPLPARGLFG